MPFKSVTAVTNFSRTRLVLISHPARHTSAMSSERGAYTVFLDLTYHLTQLSAYLYTFDENDDDPTLMVITPPMCTQSPKGHLDAYGRPYAQYPSFFGLCYAVSTNHIVDMCKRTGDGYYGDRCFTIIKFFERLEAATGVNRDNGIHRVELPSGLIAYLLVISCSDQLETLPHPKNRIQKFKQVLHTNRDPIPRKLGQPRVRQLSYLFIPLTDDPPDVRRGIVYVAFGSDISWMDLLLRYISFYLLSRRCNACPHYVGFRCQYAMFSFADFPRFVCSHLVAHRRARLISAVYALAYPVLEIQHRVVPHCIRSLERATRARGSHVR